MILACPKKYFWIGFVFKLDSTFLINPFTLYCYQILKRVTFKKYIKLNLFLI